MVELGWTTIHVDESHGGAGYGFADLAVVLHELGRALTPSPFLASAVLAAGALSLADNDEVGATGLRALSGGSLGAVAFAGTHGSFEPHRLTTTWRTAGGDVRLAGTAGFVLDADVADLLIVAARNDEDVVAVLSVDAHDPGIGIDRVVTVDETRRLFTVAFDDVAVAEERHLAAPGDAAEQLLERLLAVGVVAAACDAVGIAERAMDVAAEYARSRVQFGKPIGSFQAVKHHAANMAIAVETARAAVDAAAVTLDGDPAEWATAAAVTASYVGPACSRACDLGLLIHGGIGFTWEQDDHLRLKRAKLDEVLFGTPSWHRRRLADAAFGTTSTNGVHS
jgi:alkylation response protein AidB-like acyl-CoA dehydrogenase